MDFSKSSHERGFALQKYLMLHSQHDALQKNITQICASISPTSTAVISPSLSSPNATPDRSCTDSMSSSSSSELSSDDNNTVSSLPPSTHVRHHHRSGNVSRQRPSRPATLARASSLPTVVDESIIGEIQLEEMKMRNVNLQIKSTLTELLNCESVRSDGRYRMWVQSRLMEAEQELRGARRRRSE